MPADTVTRTRTATRRANVIRAAAAGMTPEQIVQNVDGVTSTGQAAQDLRRGLADAMVLRKLDRESLRELELRSLAATQVAVEGVLRRAAAAAAAVGGQRAQPGPGTGKSDQMILAAAHRLMQITDRRLLLEGLAHLPAAEAPEDELARRRNRVAARRRSG